MHDIFEGVYKFDIYNLLVNYRIITLNEINSRKSLFPYGDTKVDNSFVKIYMNRLKTFNLKTKQNVLPTYCP